MEIPHLLEWHPSMDRNMPCYLPQQQRATPAKLNFWFVNRYHPTEHNRYLGVPQDIGIGISYPELEVCIVKKRSKALYLQANATRSLALVLHTESVVIHSLGLAAPPIMEHKSAAFSLLPSLRVRIQGPPGGERGVEGRGHALT